MKNVNVPTATGAKSTTFYNLNVIEFVANFFRFLVPTKATHTQLVQDFEIVDGRFMGGHHTNPQCLCVFEKFYNHPTHPLEMLIAMGYRIKSKVATKFRQWASFSE